MTKSALDHATMSMAVELAKHKVGQPRSQAIFEHIDRIHYVIMTSGGARIFPRGGYGTFSRLSVLKYLNQ